MRIGFDVTPLLVSRSGVGRYTAQLLSGLRRYAPDHQYHPLTHRSLLDPDVPSGAGQPGIIKGGPALPIKTIWMQLFVPWALRRIGLDVGHFTNYVAPVAAPCPLVATFHDMSLFLMPGSYLRKDVVPVRPLLPLIARRARALITVSESARRDLLRIFRIPRERVHVVYEAAAPGFEPIADQAFLSVVARRYQLAPGYLLYVGTIEPRKNLIRVIEALHQLHRTGLRQPLVIVGKLGWRYDGLFARIEALGLREAVRFTGYVPDEDLPALYNLAGACLFPSLYEGFGLPVVEAMACGTPVVTTCYGATAEVAGDAALLVDPRRSSEIAEAAATVLTDQHLWQRLSIAGRARAAQFSWERAARETVAVYELALGGLEASRSGTPAGPVGSLPESAGS